jgi:putative GTP pyrophosphokinase
MGLVEDEQFDASQTADFEQLRKEAVSAYLQRQDYYRDVAFAVRRIVEECLSKRGIQVHSVQSRAKTATSVGKKAAQPSEVDPSKPKYTDPLNQITDLAAVRVIAFFPKTISQIETLLEEEFEVVERFDKGKQLIEEEKFGYQSLHYLVRLSSSRGVLAEYERFRATVVEIQIRTILQHAWAEIEHDIQYKAADAIPTEIRRRFMSLAGLLEIADREFQAIQDADRKLTTEARASVKRGDLGSVEITADALRAFLDENLGPDGRLTEYSYIWLARMLKSLGFRTLDQVATCIKPFNPDELSYLASGGRQGQGTRFELALLAGMQRQYVDRHPYAKESWWPGICERRLEAFRNGGVTLWSYDPQTVR